MSENTTGKTSGLAIAALICGILAFFCNPCYLMGLVAIILGGIALSKHDSTSKGMAIAGLVLGIFTTVYQITFDIIFTVCTMGTGFFSFFI